MHWSILALISSSLIEDVSRDASAFRYETAFDTNDLRSGSGTSACSVDPMVGSTGSRLWHDLWHTPRDGWPP